MKKKLIYGVLLINLINIVQCKASLQTALAGYAAANVLIGGAIWSANRTEAKKKEKSLDDTPYHFQQWAREIFTKNGFKNAETIPLKIDGGWCCDHDLFITAPYDKVKDIDDIIAGRDTTYTKDEQKAILEIGECCLLHELKHKSNYDSTKGLLLRSAIATLPIPVLLSRKDLFTYAASSVKSRRLINVVGLSAFGMSKIADIVYSRYQEKEADRYAYSHMSLEKLPTIKSLWESKNAECEQILLSLADDKVFLMDALVDRPIMYAAFQNLRGINAAISEGSGDMKKLHEKKARALKGLNFILDPKHPDPLDRAALAQECYDKRKKEELTA